MICEMEGTTSFLIGIYPPSNIERTLFEVKESLFRRFSTVSAVALGPILPLGYVDVAPPEPDPATLPRGIVLSTGEWVFAEETFFLEAHPRNQLEELAKSLPQTSGQSARGKLSATTGGPVPVYPGFFLSCMRELSSSHRWRELPNDNREPVDERTDPARGKDLLAFLKNPPRMKWTGSILACWCLRYVSSGFWWDSFECEEIWSTRLRKGEDGESTRSGLRY